MSTVSPANSPVFYTVEIVKIAPKYVQNSTIWSYGFRLYQSLGHVFGHLVFYLFGLRYQLDHFLSVPLRTGLVCVTIFSFLLNFVKTF